MVRSARVGVVGATGAVGTVTLALLRERGYENVRAFASLPSALAEARHGPFVGRSAHMHELSRMWQEVVAGGRQVVVLSGEPGTARAEEAAERILAALATPFRQGNYELVVTPSIGIALYPEHGADFLRLVRKQPEPAD